MKKAIKAHEERNVKTADEKEPSTPMPSYLLDRTNPSQAKALSSAIKNKRAEKAAKFAVPLPKVRGIAEQEMFSVVKTGKKTAKKAWKRMITVNMDSISTVRLVGRCLTDGCVETYLCWARFHEKEPQIRKVHQTIRIKVGTLVISHRRPR